MLSRPRLVLVVLMVGTALFTACVKPIEKAPPPPAPAAPVDAFSTAATVAPTTGPSAAGIYGASIAAAERAKARVEVASTATRDNGAIYKDAKTLFDQKQYSEASRVLDSISVELLTPQQEKAVSDLRAQIKQALGH